MTQRFVCPTCGKSMIVADLTPGDTVQCRSCGAEIAGRADNSINTEDNTGLKAPADSNAVPSASRTVEEYDLNAIWKLAGDDDPTTEDRLREIGRKNPDLLLSFLNLDWGAWLREQTGYQKLKIFPIQSTLHEQIPEIVKSKVLRCLPDIHTPQVVETLTRVADPGYPSSHYPQFAREAAVAKLAVLGEFDSLVSCPMFCLHNCC